MSPHHPTALVADDEEAPRAALVAALQQAWPELRIVALAANGVDAWDAWLEHEPDLCFLDIRMPGLTGIDVARRIDGRTPVVFVTAYGDHAMAAFDAGAVDYVMKPVEPERLQQAVRRLRQRLAAPAAAAPAGLQDLLAQLAGQMRPAARLEVIQAAVGKEVRLIRVEEVVYFEADARYTRVVYSADGLSGEALIRTPLKELLAQLDERAFCQVHRSVIVNQLHIAAAVRVDEGVMHLTLRGRSDTLPVSRQFQGLFKGQ
ncbi:MAG: response regulator transcription factor [Vitreoscilla sp.]|nr:response regulator transcription factor [Burkholderiales bacterium]MBP6337268.1 response regulator transcription factor [Vitreoscilla sp.]MBP6674546.1 response regulator transcription factor [Vitreoscilla sp.]